MKRPEFKFTLRDSDLLLDLYKHRFLSVVQLQRLHFPSLQTTYRRLRVLREQGYVQMFNVANIDEAIFTVGSSGLGAVARALGVELADLKWSHTTAKPRDHYFMRHFLAINDFRITLRLACTDSTTKLLGFIPDYYGEKTTKGGVHKYIRDAICDIAADRQVVSHTPDGVFALEREAKCALFFVEIDRGTETVSDLEKGVLKSLRFYSNYLLEGRYQRYASDFGVPEFRGFRALYVTISEERLANIRLAAAKLGGPQKAKRFHWVTTFDRLNEKTLFTPIWRSCDQEDPVHYQIG
ncbi:MAG: replication-relaxation family protein [Candidatus Zixiibacteriota bacterium]